MGQAARPLVDVFFHTNRGIALRPRPAGYAAHTGWWNDSRHAMNASLAAVQPVNCEASNFSATVCARRHRRLAHALVTLATAYKYAWVVETSARLAVGSSKGSSHDRRPLVLADTDTVVQCEAHELYDRFVAFNASLVVSAEVQMWPLVATSANPWARPGPGRPSGPLR